MRNYEVIGREFIKFMTVIMPEVDWNQKAAEPEKTDETVINAKVVITLTPEQKRKNIGLKGFGYSSGYCYNGTDAEYEILNKIVADRPQIRLRNEDEVYVKTKVGVLCCENVALYMIKKGADNGKLLAETLDIAIAAHMHEVHNGLCAAALITIFRLLCLHQRKNHNKVKEFLVEIMQKNTINSLTVLAKATEKYTQRTPADMRVMYVESLLAEHPGIRDQFLLIDKEEKVA